MLDTATITLNGSVPFWWDGANNPDWTTEEGGVVNAFNGTGGGTYDWRFEELTGQPFSVIVNTTNTTLIDGNGTPIAAGTYPIVWA